jgi:fibronectin type 3 domain-containing protein
LEVLDKGVYQMKINRQNALLCALLAALLLAGCKDLFHPEGSEKSNSNPGGGPAEDEPAKDEPPEDEPNTGTTLSAPQSIYADALSSSEIGVHWESVSGADSYGLYRSNSSSGGYSLVTSIGLHLGTSYIDTGLAPSTTYYYKVSAFDGSGGESPKSSYASAKTLSNSPPKDEPNTGTTLSAPQGLHVESYDFHTITIRWNPVSGASGYKVYRSLYSYGEYFLVGDVQEFTGYTDAGLPPSTTYYYRVSAYNSHGESPKSEEYVYTTTLTLW